MDTRDLLRIFFRQMQNPIFLKDISMDSDELVSVRNGLFLTNSKLYLNTYSVRTYELARVANIGPI